jgi:hypothetical protein
MTVKKNYEYLNDFIRIRKTESGYVVDVYVVEWRGAHRPTKVIADSFHFSGLSPRKIKSTMWSNQKYFRVCSQCNQLLNIGHLHVNFDQGKDVCHSCAERYYQIIH